MSLPRITILFFILFCLVLVNAQPAFSDTYSSNQFSITYPSGWEYQEQPSTDAQTHLVVLFSNNIQTPEVNLWVELKDNSIIASDDQTYLSELSSENKNYCDTLKSNGNSCYYSGLDESKTLEINGMKAYQIRFSWYGIDSKTVTHPNTSIVTEIPLGSKTWVVEASTAQYYYSKYVDMIQSTTQSFSLVSPTQNPIPNNPSNQQTPPPNTTIQQDTLTVSTDKFYYTDNDKIFVSGQVGQAVSGFPVVIRIQTPNGNLLSTQQVTTSPDGAYSTVINAGGNSWIQEGTYTIFAQYGVKNISAQTTFDFKKTTPIPSGQSQPTQEQPQTPQTPQENTPGLQMKIDLSGNTLYIIIGAIIAVIAGISIYFVSKSKKSDTVSTEIPPQFGRGDASRIIELKGKTIYVDITVQYPDRKSSSSWNYGTDRKIGSGSGGGYLLTVNLNKRDKSLMTEIVDIIEKYGFNSLLVNFQNHKSFKSSQDVGTTKAMVLLDEICYDLETKYDINKSTKSYSSNDDRVEDHTSGSPIHEPHTSKTRNVGPVPEPHNDTKPPKVESKHARESVFTGKAPINEINEQTRQKQAEEKRRQEKEIEEIRRKQEEERQKREWENQSNSRQNIQTQFDPYQVLGLSRTCSCAEVKARYRELITKKENSLNNMLNMSEEEVVRRTKIQSDINKAREQIMNEKNCGK